MNCEVRVRGLLMETLEMMGVNGARLWFDLPDMVSLQALP